MSKIKIFLLEDDQILGEQISFMLEANHFDTTWSHTIDDATKNLRNNQYDISIFDINIGSGSSLELFENFKNESIKKSPTLFLSANGTDENVIKALELGANDFIHKPINEKELLLRINTHIRVLNIKSQLEFAHLYLDPEQKMVNYSGTQVSFSATQIMILKLLFINSNKIIKRESILTEINDKGDIDQRTLDSHISQIRKKFREKQIRHVSIESVYKIGYRFTNNED